MRFINCVKLNFGKIYRPSDSHINTVNSDRFSLPVKMAPKTLIRPISCNYVTSHLGSQIINNVIISENSLTAFSLASLYHA